MMTIVVVVVVVVRMRMILTMTVMLMIMITTSSSTLMMMMAMMMMAMTMMIMTMTVMTLMMNLYRSRLPDRPSLAASKSLPAGWKIFNSSSKILCLSKSYLVLDNVLSCNCLSYMLCWSAQKGIYRREKGCLLSLLYCALYNLF